MTSEQPPVEYHVARAAEMDPVTLYRVLKIRVDVFVVEQTALFADLDGRDIEDGTLIAWAQEGDEVLATIRILTEAEHSEIGRVATAFTARGRGLAAELIRRAVADHGHRELRMGAQKRLADWYGQFGFEISGPDYVEDDIVHVPMTRLATPSD
ncbi:GNAT family N-acetyltransferase [Plantibacter sp. ME-Dv--P-122b]|uniref:GNAT family N-acetyltransferase n=1 Tax=Plantibacter sp. ME-Dv--P-122b TaxID=3040300 RepID=UPI00254ACCEB|nr:GNAT family N-acetyltransferase [Plantibacter sp. ME-Dv--P-122b]